jgi:hypothetical protein
MKAYGRVELRVQSFLTSTLGGGECTASPPKRFTTEAEGAGTHRLSESHGGAGHFGKDKNRLLLPNMEPRAIGCSSPTLVTALTKPSRLLTEKKMLVQLFEATSLLTYLNRASYVHNQLAAAIACWVILFYCFTLPLRFEIPGVACKSVFSHIIL